MIKNNNNNTVQRRDRKKTHFPLQPNFGEISASFLAYHLDNASALPSPPPPPPQTLQREKQTNRAEKSVTHLPESRECNAWMPKQLIFPVISFHGTKRQKT